MGFMPGYVQPTEAVETAKWFVFHAGKILVNQASNEAVEPYFTEPKKLGGRLLHQQFFGVWDGIPCYTAELDQGTVAPQGTVWRELRELLGVLDDELFAVAGYANQMMHWNQNHQYCGRCGDPTRNKADEQAKICFSCGLINFPRVTPAIIVAVVKNECILLARSTRFRSNFFSVLAGFVEPGENLEDCVKREVKEEAGVNVKNIKYFGSQPWPFPNSLMVAFTAEYAGGELTIDASEIVEAHWFSRDRLPRIPAKQTIARQLIDWFVTARHRPI